MLSTAPGTLILWQRLTLLRKLAYLQVSHIRAACRAHNEGGNMRIGIIGAGQIGGTLARRLRAAGHDVSIANSRGPASLAALAQETGVRPVTVEEAVRAGDVVIVTIPMKNVPRLPAGLFQGV